MDEQLTSIYIGIHFKIIDYKQHNIIKYVQSEEFEDIQHVLKLMKIV